MQPLFDAWHRPFPAAREYVRTQGLRSIEEYMIWRFTQERPGDIPLSPEWAYEACGWTSWADFLDAPIVFRSFSESRKYVQALELNSIEEYAAWAKSGRKPLDIPTHPAVAYKDTGWISAQDFLGTSTPTASTVAWDAAWDAAHKKDEG